SRRRHTRFSRDWSSDVCSSDLPALTTGLLLDEGHGKDGREIFGTHRLLGGRVQGRLGRRGQIRHDVVPLLGDLALGQENLDVAQLVYAPLVFPVHGCGRMRKSFASTAASPALARVRKDRHGGKRGTARVGSSCNL